jgi:hypothetical protein
MAQRCRKMILDKIPERVVDYINKEARIQPITLEEIRATLKALLQGSCLGEYGLDPVF